MNHPMRLEFWKQKKVWLSAAALALAAASYAGLQGQCSESARRMAFIFVLAASFWTFEMIPLYATALWVVFLESFLLVRPLGMGSGLETYFIGPLADPVIVLFLGGFILARAFAKYGIDSSIATCLLRHAGNRPYFMLLSFMAATAFLGMWISNTATSALMLAVLLPLLGSLDAGDPFRKALVLGIPFAARIGGITTPVGSPTNALALGLLAERGIHVNFLTWMSATFPLAVLLLLMTSGILYILFPPRQAAVPCSMEPARPFDRDARLVLFIGAATAGLWLTSPWHRMPEYLTALLCAGVLAATRLITVEDLKKIDWDILILMWGGLALGEGMMITGLADWAMTLPVYPHEKWLLYLAVCLVTVLLSTFMSNTATVNLLIPVALSIPAGDASMLAVLVALAASFDLGLPISTPPMAMAYGTKELSISDMLKAGTVFALVANVLLLAGVEFMMKEVFVR